MRDQRSTKWSAVLAWLVSSIVAGCGASSTTSPDDSADAFSDSDAPAAATDTQRSDAPFPDTHMFDTGTADIQNPDTQMPDTQTPDTQMPASSVTLPSAKSLVITYRVDGAIYASIQHF